MNALETLEKYGLKTDVKSIRERLNDALLNDINDGFKTAELVFEANEEQVEILNADLALLCELAEKGERYEKAVKHRYKNEKALVQSYAETWGKSHIENAPKHIQDGYMELHSQHSLEADKLARIIVEAEGEPK